MSIDIELHPEGALIKVPFEVGGEECFQSLLTLAELAQLTDLATQALAESKGWEFLTRPAITLEPGDLLAFCESPIIGCGTINSGNTMELYFADGTSMECDSRMTVSYLRRIR